ncbi:unnamed protein product [Peronospora belbahrii]|uniref:RWP-RK domain-containing protein n=1 Tax=Peronospora belbahrii TaxID=622444 RepID=A0AAU9LBP8_9STRA|nr:unnamed protein product [Peronospora belbahrii]CAH0517231.1 unnamed protein product [Peronospora belbahrii]
MKNIQHATGLRNHQGYGARTLKVRRSALLSMSPACNFQAFSLYFHLPLKVAAEKFGVRATAFKKRCRAIGIRHWPYRKVRSLKRSLQELHQCKHKAPLNDKQKAQFDTFKHQLDKLMAPETYGLDPLGYLRPYQHQQLLLTSDDDEEHTESDEDGYDSLGSQSPSDTLIDDCTISPKDGDIKTLGGIVPVGSANLCTGRSPIMHLSPAHLSFFDNGSKHVLHNEACYLQEQYFSHDNGFVIPCEVDKATALVMKTSTPSLKKQTEHYPSIGFESIDLDFLPSETNARLLDDADEEFTTDVNQVDYSSERFFDDVFLQISPDYGCLV